MNVRIQLAGLALAVTASPLAAQLIRVPRPEEDRRAITVAVDAGLLLTERRFDATDGTYWNLGESFAYRLGADVQISAGSIGLAATLATVPLQRSGFGGSDGDIQFRQLVATFRSPEGRSFHQLIEISAGWSQWANYSGTDVLTSEQQEPRNGFVLAVGYGFAFPIGSRATITLVQDAGTVIGSGRDLPAGVSRIQRQYTTRIGLRVRAAGAR